MFTIQDTSASDLPKLAECQMACFPKSFSTKLGKNYVRKTLGWFLADANRFIFHVVENEKVVGYCGGFTPIKPGDGSSSGMLQYAFADALKGLLKNPFLLLHRDLRSHYPFIWLNIKRKITGKVKPIEKPDVAKPFTPYASLVIIGVHPSSQGKGIAQMLMKEFEVRVKTLRKNEIVLSVKKDNSRALKAYISFGFSLKEEHNKTYVMHKMVTA